MRDVAHDGKATARMVVRAPWLTQGYYKNPEASEALWQGGYLHTNDIANLGPNGYLQITDRIKDVIKTGGEWVSSAGTRRHHHARAGGKGSRRHWNQGRERRTSDGPYRSRPSGGHTPDENAIKAHVGAFADKGVISKYGVPRTILCADDLERTSVGKLDKKALRLGHMRRTTSRPSR